MSDEAAWKWRLATAKAIEQFRCEGCGVLAGHTDTCTVHALLDQVDDALNGLPVEPQPVQVPVTAAPLPVARYYDVRPSWHRRLERWAASSFWRALGRGILLYFIFRGIVWLLS